MNNITTDIIETYKGTVNIVLLNKYEHPINNISIVAIVINTTMKDINLLSIIELLFSSSNGFLHIY